MVEETEYDDVVEYDHSYDNDDYVGDDGRGDGLRLCSGVRLLQ